MPARKGNPHPSQEPMLRAQLERRDAYIERLMDELRPLREVELEARAVHEKTCDCVGEACQLGAALNRLSVIRQRSEGRRTLRQGSNTMRIVGKGY